MYDYRANKIVVVIASDLEAGVALNITGHLAVSLGAHCMSDLMGRPQLVDASGVSHRGIAKYPFIVTKAKPQKLRQLLETARMTHDLFVADYPAPMLATGHDDELAEAIKAEREEDLKYLGVLLFGRTETVSELTGKFSLWK